MTGAQRMEGRNGGDTIVRVSYCLKVNCYKRYIINPMAITKKGKKVWTINLSVGQKFIKITFRGWH